MLSNPYEIVKQFKWATNYQQPGLALIHITHARSDAHFTKGHKVTGFSNFYALVNGLAFRKQTSKVDHVRFNPAWKNCAL